VLDSIVDLVELRMYLRLIMFWYTMVLILHFFKVYRGQPHLAQLSSTIISAAEDLLHFVMMFLVVFFNFAFAGYSVWGQALDSWSTPGKAINTAFKALMGDVDIPEMYSVSPWSTLCWYSLFLGSLVFVMMNLLFAIIFDHYSIVKTKVGATTGMASQWMALIRDMKQRLGGFRRVLCYCCRKDENLSHQHLLEELTRRAGYTEEEAREAQSTVLGFKWFRSEHERLVFSGEVGEEAAAMASALAKPDLQEVGMDPEYLEELLDETRRHMAREYDTTENRLAQLRELVALSEIEMSSMRSRLSVCQENVRGTLFDASRRMESLEQSVHSSLAQLVIVAGAAGVPDRAQWMSPKLDTSWVPRDEHGVVSRKQQVTMGRIQGHTGQKAEVPSHLNVSKQHVQNWAASTRAIHKRNVINNRIKRPS